MELTSWAVVKLSSLSVKSIVIFANSSASDEADMMRFFRPDITTPSNTCFWIVLDGCWGAGTGVEGNVILRKESSVCVLKTLDGAGESRMVILRKESSGSTMLREVSSDAVDGLRTTIRLARLDRVGRLMMISLSGLEETYRRGDGDLAGVEKALGSWASFLPGLAGFGGGDTERRGTLVILEA